MRVEKLRVEGFRLLEDVELLLEPGATVIVGRNNSGKTSLTEIFDRLAGEQGPRFRLEDFSAGVRPRFQEAYALRRIGGHCGGSKPMESVVEKRCRDGCRRLRCDGRARTRSDRAGPGSGRSEAASPGEGGGESGRAR